MIVALHGFLGKPADWSFLRNHYELFAPDLFESQSALNRLGFSGFIHELDSLLVDKKSDILLGYSLGGRLALHSLFNGKTQFKAAIFVSTHFGLGSDYDRSQRIVHDKKWAAKFMNQDWQSLITEWNQQPVFKQDTSRLKCKDLEDQISRQSLAHVLEDFSLGLQESFLEKLNTTKIPCLWITGELDDKFCKLADQIENSNKTFKKFVIKSAGHRVAWDNQNDFFEQLKIFLDGVDYLSYDKNNS